MVLAVNVATSKKRLGMYEKRLIDQLAKYFLNSGFQVVPHSRLNFAWGSILSDVDLLLLKDNLLTYVEVKSCRDKVDRANEQIERIKDFVDYAYLATEKETPTLDDPQLGLIYVKDNSVNIVKIAKKFNNKPNFLSMLMLKKKCLAMFFNISSKEVRQINKYDLAQNIFSRRPSKCSRKYLREIVTCGEHCDLFCPILGQPKNEFTT